MVLKKQDAFSAKRTSWLTSPLCTWLDAIASRQ